ncbi:MAG: hypothetical protein R3C97_03040 [Geminicoccaceae bacterium]
MVRSRAPDDVVAACRDRHERIDDLRLEKSEFADRLSRVPRLDGRARS